MSEAPGRAQVDSNPAVGQAAVQGPRVLITAPFDPGVLAELRMHATADVISVDDSGLDDAVRLGPADLADVEVLVVESAAVDAAVLEAAPSLRLVVACRSNPVNVDVEACRRRGVVVATTPARNAEVTADMAFALLLSCVRQLSRAERWLRGGNWTEEAKYFPYRFFRGPALAGRTLGVIGLGAVGGRVAKRATGFGMRVIAHDPVPPDDPDLAFVELLGLHEVLAQAEMVSVHVPLTDATVGLIGRGELAAMRPGAFLVNSARAAVIDEDAFIEALSSGHLAGAGLDVYHEEPLPPSSPLLGFENVVLTPHIGGASDDVVLRHSRLAFEAIAEFTTNR